jgi:hypothetical protein
VKVTKKGVYFAFRDQGACISIMAVKVSWNNTYIINNMIIIVFTFVYYKKN